MPNSGFEQGIDVGAGWVQAGTCSFIEDGPGHDSASSALIHADSASNKDCQLLSLINEMAVVEGETYDYSAWILPDLQEGQAYLAVTFWRLQNKTLKQVDVPALTEVVTNVSEVWIQVTGSVQAPAGAQFARVEATLAEYSIGSARFDDIYLGHSTCLDVNKTGYPNEVIPGSILTLTIMYSNTGRQLATDIHIVEEFDEAVELIWDLTDPPPDMGDNVWQVSYLDPGVRRAITAVVQVEDEVEERSWLVNEVQVRYHEMDDALDPISSTLLTHLVIPTRTCAIDLSLAEEEKAGRPGQVVSYDLMLRNLGDCEGQYVLTATSSLEDWTPQVEPETGVLPMNGEQAGSLSLTIPENVPSGLTNATFLTATLRCDLPYNNRSRDDETVDTAVISIGFLPLVAKNWHDPSWESEPNDHCEEADGPLSVSRQHYGYTNDKWDLWTLEHTGGKFRADLTVDLDRGVQLYLFDESCEYVEGCEDRNPDDGYQFLCAESSGRYYIGIWTADYGRGYGTPYILDLSFPQ